MRINNRSLLPILLVSACFTAGSCLAAEAADHADHAAAGDQAASVSAVKAGQWSDASTWSGGALPKAGDVVTIDAGMDLVLDVSTPALHGINLNGKLTFADDKDLELTTEWILMRGGLEIGTESKPHTRNATITLTNNVPDEVINGMGDRGIMVVGGTLSLHGDRDNSWSKLSATAAAGSQP